MNIGLDDEFCEEKPSRVGGLRETSKAMRVPLQTELLGKAFQQKHLVEGVPVVAQW